MPRPTILTPILLASAALASGAGSYARDWTKSPAIIVRPAAATLYAIGDIHGDYQRLIRLLVAAHITPAEPANPRDIQWSAGEATLVVTGDMIDKGPHPVAVLRTLMALRTAARQSKGEVILLAGNHEAEFLAGPDPKKAADFIDDLKHNGYDAAHVAACQGDLGEFLCTLPFAARVGDWFFSHAGNTAGRTLAEISLDLQKGVDHDGYRSEQLIGPDSLLEARLGEGNTWFEVSNDGSVTAERERQLLAAYAQAVGAKHIVEGHQHNEVRFADGVERKTGEMFQRWGLLFLIDVGMSEGVGDSHGAALRIANGKASAVCADGAESVIWGGAAQADQGRIAPCSR